MSGKIHTRDHNIDILQDLGYRKFKNTTVFQNGSKFIISPAVSVGSSGKYWFDIREVNLNRINTDEEALLLVRIVPNLFILDYLKRFSSLFTQQLMDNRPNSGNVWGIHIEMNKKLDQAYLFNTKKSSNKIKVKLLQIGNIGKFLEKFAKV